MKKYKSTQKGFTLIELLMVVALIAILSTVILIQLDSGRERASLNKYLAYGTQMHKVVADAVAAGKFDRSTLSDDYAVKMCLGLYDDGCETPLEVDAGAAKSAYDAIIYLGELPPLEDGQGESPYNSDDTHGGVHMEIDRSTTSGVLFNNIRIYMYVLNGTTHKAHLKKVCNSINWAVDGDSCYKDVPLSARM